jgi:uncharacterized membrane protein
MTDAGGDGEAPRSRSDEARLAALEAEVAELRGQLTELRSRLRPTEPSMRSAEAPPTSRPAAPSELERRSRTGSSARRASLSGDALESWVGRYGTLVAAACVILLGVGTLVVWAVQRGLLSPELRIAGGAATTACVAAAGWQFRRRGERRYGNVLLALALAMTDVVAWGAGPRLHIVPAGVALLVVDVVAIAIAWLATQDESEFLFGVAMAGALSAPFVTTDEAGRPDTLLAYGALVLLGGMRASRHSHWRRAMTLLIAGAALYELAAAGLPSVSSWYGPFLIPLFGAVLALGALILADPAWRGVLARAFLAAALIGVLFGWDTIPGVPALLTFGVAGALLATTYAALWVARPEQPLWAASALLLPFLSLGVALARAEGRAGVTILYLIWSFIALAMWRAERWRERADRAGAHLLLATLLAGVGVTHQLWSIPLALVGGLGLVGIGAAYLVRDEESTLPAIGLVLVLGGVVLSAMDQLRSLQPYAYTPFGSRASASALLALLSVAGASVVLDGGRGLAARLLGRPLRVGATVALAFLWGRMELVHAISRDAGTFLLTLYYAASGVAGIVAGRKVESKALRVAGLAVAIYAAAKAVIEANEIGGLALRVGCYAAVGVFLLGAGYLYRNAGTEREPDATREGAGAAVPGTEYH